MSRRESHEEPRLPSTNPAPPRHKPTWVSITTHVGAGTNGFDRWRVAAFLFLAVLTIETILLVWWPLTLVPVPRVGNYNEGWNAYHALDVANGEFLYANDFTPLNYPPLSFVLVAALGLIVPDYLLIGRVAAVLSLLVIAAALGSVVFRMTGSRAGGLVTGLTTIMLIAAVAPTYVGADDPQLMAHAFLMCALAIYVSFRDEPRAGHVFVVAGLVCLGLLIKHNPIAVPLAITWDIVRHRRSLLRTWLTALLVTGGSAALVLQIWFGNAVWEALLSPRQITSRQWADVTFDTLRYSWIWVVALSGFMVRVTGDRQLGILTRLLIVAAATGALMAGGIGTYRNVYFDVFFALAMLVGAHLTGSSSKQSRSAVLLAVVIIVTGAGWVRVRWPSQERVNAAYKVAVGTQESASVLKTIPGPAFCQQPLVCYLAEKKFEYDAFLVTQRIAAGSIAERDVVALFENRRFAAVHVDEVIPEIFERAEKTAVPLLVGEHFTRNILVAIRRNYALKHTSAAGAVYVAQAATE